MASLSTSGPPSNCPFVFITVVSSQRTVASLHLNYDDFKSNHLLPTTNSCDWRFTLNLWPKDSSKRSYAEVVSSSTSLESEHFHATNRTSLKNFTPTVRSEVKKEGKKDDFDCNKIGEACGGFIEAAPETVDKAELTEDLIKVKDNYTRRTSHAERQNLKGKKELNEINLVVDLGHISPLSDTNFSSPEGSSYTPSSLSPTESEIVKDSLGNMVMSDQEEWEKQSLKNQGEENDEEANFKRKLTKWLKDNNLRLSSEFISTCDDVVDPLQIVPPNLNFEKMNDDVIDGEEQDTMGQTVYP
ncbi:uncharacterized protein E6C27_scaffold385G00750 [Cucumis melo var. makuwa]|uniref:Uncharacterized protein n=1 Tax=Cucumis melo var. makuwa TaxID=1194695 RepID=A0A5A7U3I3_CUCMM|nr:uncharacterized protein E6C27_scaffold385G00750 [Cucumis melo var. makuwa]